MHATLGIVWNLFGVARLSGTVARVYRLLDVDRRAKAGTRKRRL